MKKLILVAVVICFAGAGFAQSDKYVSAMKTNIALLDSMWARDNGAELANNFARIGDAEKTQWLPYYYAAYCTVMPAYSGNDVSKKDPLADKAQQFIDKAEAILGKENSETDVIKAMIASAHMTVDPQNRYMTYGTAYTGFIEKSKALDPTNPRPVLIEAQVKFFTPKEYSGGPDAAKEYFDKTSALMEKFKPETELSPNWGAAALQFFLSKYK